MLAEGAHDHIHTVGRAMVLIAYHPSNDLDAPLGKDLFQARFPVLRFRVEQGQEAAALGEILFNLLKLVLEQGRNRAAVKALSPAKEISLRVKVRSFSFGTCSTV